MIEMDWTAVAVGLMTLLGGCAWFVEGRKHKPTANGLKADYRLKNMELGQMYVEQFEENIAEPLRREVRELREEVNELRHELDMVKKNACYCAGCPNRISVL
jgi:hypothetical protein